MTSERDFDRIMRSMFSNDLPPVEVVSGDFRAIAKNFLSLPIQLLLDLKEAQIMQDGSDLLLLFDAAELAFNEEDFERLKDMNIRDFLNAIQAWIYADRNNE